VATLSQNGSIPPDPTGFANVEFDPVGRVTLDPTRFYWFVLSGSSSDGTGSVEWQFTESTTHGGPGTLPDFASIFFDFPPAQWQVVPDSPFLIQVNGTAVPESSSWILGSLGFAALILVSRWSGWRRRRA
jgi:hypothetical protein